MWALIISAFSWIWGGIQAGFDVIVIALQWAYKGLKWFGGAIWDAAKFTYQNILKPVGEFLHKAYDRLKAFYDKVVAPIHKWATRITKAVRDVYTTYFRPILSAIDGVRRVVELLRLLHISWAAQLDDFLANLERKIAFPIMEVIKVVNMIDSRIEAYILTADNLFRKATLIGSIRRDLDPLLNMQWNRMLGTLSPRQREGPTGSDDYRTVDESMQFFTDVLNGNADAVGFDPDAALAFFEQLTTTGTVSMWTSG